MTAYEDQNEGPKAVTVCAIFMVATTIFAGARVFCRMSLRDALRLDDWIILVSMATGWIAFVFNYMAVVSGLGRHQDTLTLDEASHVVLWTLTGFVPGILFLTLPKLAVISLLTRLLLPSRRHQQFMWSYAALMMANAFVNFGLGLGRCVPFQAVWDMTYTGPKTCHVTFWQVVWFATYTTVVCAVADLYLAVYPALVLRKLQMNPKKKLALSIALGIGSISVVVAAYKATQLKAMADADFSYKNANLNIWTIIEGSVVNIAACIPLLRPLVDRIFGSQVFGSGYAYKPSACLKDTASTGRFDRPRKRRTMTNLIHDAAGASQEHMNWERLDVEAQSDKAAPITSSSRTNSSIAMYKMDDSSHRHGEK